MNAFVEFISSHLPLEADEAAQFEKVLFTKTYHSNDIILREGNMCASILFVVSGTARSYFINHAGQEYTWNFYFNDSDSKFENFFVLDYSSFLQQTPTPLTFQVIEDLELIGLRYDHLQILLQQSPKMQDVSRVMTERAYSSIHKRAFSFLGLSAKERYLELLNMEPYLLNKFQHYLIASYLGIAPQSLSRLRKEILQP
jgi:CRP-like cAMP-binding protein